jgi:hypothetical protein
VKAISKEGLQMPHQLLKAGVFAFALGCFATVGQAGVVGPLQPNSFAPLAIPVADEGTAIEQMEHPNEVPAGSQEPATPKNAAPPPPEGNASGDAEERELKRELPSTEWPPDRK